MGIIASIVTDVATEVMLAAAGIFSNFDVERPVEQFSAIG